MSARKICAILALCATLPLAGSGCGSRKEPDASVKPVPTPPGVPIGPAVSQAVGSGGATLTSADAQVQVTVPPGAAPAGLTLSIQEVTNFAPAGVGSAYQVGPEGTTFAAPVTITFRTNLVNGPLENVTVAYQDGTGYWLRLVDVTRDAAQGTVSVATRHLSAWTLVSGPSPRDLSGAFSVQSTIGVPFTADASATLSFAGEDTAESYYLLGGTEVPRTPILVGAASCTADVPTLALFTNLAEVKKSPLAYWWGTSGHWNLTCSDTTKPSISYAYDTMGMNLIGCARSYTGTPTIGPDRLAGTYTIDCGTGGKVTGAWDFKSAQCGKACQPTNPCAVGTLDCTSGTAVCTQTGTVANGTTCGTNMVCNAGTCVSCTAGLTCTGQPDPLCHAGVTSCATGTSTCVNGAALANGTTCGTNMVCNAGACTACTAGLSCTGQPDPLCHTGVTSCATGTSTCVNGVAVANGTSCGTNMVCNAGACTACTAGLSCTGQPDPLCHVGVTSCATGTSTCVNGAAIADGTSCGVNMVCSAGTCSSCTAGLACTPANPCHNGTTSCATGVQTCTDLLTNVANGVSCGTNMVCNAGACVACTAGVACTTPPDPLCHAGVTSCATGTSTCVNGAALANGTSCGTNMVCSAGACVACTAGLACTTQPDLLCHTGVTSCSTGTSTCVNGTALANGTTCGTNMVCNAGTCSPCTAGLACTTQPDLLCHTGVTSCSTGTQTCVNGTALANGTSCGTNMVCNAGACTACTAGVACTGQPDPLCHAGVTSCSTGTSTCVNGSALANGTTCGTNMVCNAGACVSCTAGVACTTQPDLLCHVGVTSCATGTSTCVNGAAVANGTSCGTNLVCNAGACVSCTAGLACATPPDPLCHAGVTSCATGTSTCVNGTALANGTSCGTNLVCNAGACVSCTAGLACTPTNPCHNGTTSCSTGTQTCTDLLTNLANGTTCGTNMVCNSGTCTACTAGLVCTPTNPCHNGTTSCSTGTQTCTDLLTNLANGTTCGTNMVCNAGTCTACTAGVACTGQPDLLCHTGVTSCATGTSTCVNGAALADGTTCGTNLVCSAGACVPCTAGLACTPTSPCHVGTTSCSTGTQTCTDTLVNVANGTSCGTNLVCNVGACVPCTAGVSCTPTNPCHTGTTSCSTGSQTCTDTLANLANGTTCGTNMVCNAGTCVSCTAGVSCTPTNPCHAGTTSCSTGSQTCTDTLANVADGTTCGTNMVCSAGTCVSCTAGLACTPTNPCHTGTTSCSTGSQTCTDTLANVANGTTCGTNMVCNAGTCTACTAGVSCTPTNPCHVGTTSCSTGTQTCTDTLANAANGVSCGTSMTCNAGTCVTSRSVTGTRLVTYWPDGTPAAPVPATDVLSATVAALVPRTGGGFDTYTGTIGLTGNVLVPNVPTGTYLLSFVDGAGNATFLETTASTVDLGYDVLGRSGASTPGASTPVTFNLTGLAAWTIGDELEITSSNANVFDVPNTAAVPALATSASVPDDWFASALGGPMNLLVAADVLWIHDLATRTTTQTGGTTLFPYLSAATAVSATGLAFTSGIPATVPATLAPAPRTGWVTGASTTGIDWRLPQFEAQLGAMTGFTLMPTGSVHTLSIGAAARALANPAPIALGNPSMFRMQLAPGAGTGTGGAFTTVSGLSYGAFLETTVWSEWRGVDFGVPVTFTLPPATTAFADRASLGRREAMTATPPTPIAPTLLAVQTPAINGLGAFATLTGVTTTPVLTWSAAPLPSVAPTSYTVEIRLLGTSGTATTSTRVARWRVASTRVEVPANLLLAGKTYYARITANVSSPDPLATKPLSGEYVTAYATTITGTFSP